MALLRSVNVPCRLHAFNVSKDFQNGAIPKIISWFTPAQILHTWVEVYFKNEMVGLIDYQLGYRFSMIHDDKCIWIGLFLVDESYQRKGFGKEILNKVVKKYGDFYNRIQLACIRDNFKGLVFWKKMGFKEIATSSYCNLEVIIFEKKI